MPKQAEKILKYIHGEKSLKAPFTIYLDLECLLKKNNRDKIIPNNLTQRKRLYMGLLVGECLQVVHSMKKKINLIITEKKELCYDKNDKNYTNRKKVKDHCHYTGKYRGAAHSKCNLNYKVPKDIPIIIHNASYDTHFIINQLAEEFKDELNCIGENMEKYISFSAPIKKKCDDSKTITYKLRFIDSFRFMSTSLSELLDNMSGNLIV